MSKDRPMETGRFEIDPRYQRLAASSSIRSIYDAAVELITNCHDSYGNLGEPTRVKIEALHGRSGNRFLRVADRAEGMSHEELFQKMTRPGQRFAREGARGFMGRGAKDIVALGDVEIETIKDGRLSRLLLTREFSFKRFKARDATPADREHLGIRRNGTVVTLRPKDGITFPHHATLQDRLPRLYALRDIFSAESANRIVLVDVTSEPHTSTNLEYRNPAGSKVLEETFVVDADDYPGVEATLTVWRADERIEAPRYGSRFDEAGFIVSSNRAIHELTFFDSNIASDPLARYYFGRLDVPYIDDLCSQFDAAQTSGDVIPENPILIIDPDRNEGITRDHPFAQCLYSRPAEILEELLADHRKELRETERRLESQDIRRRLNELERLTSDFIRDELFQTPGGDAPAPLPAVPPTDLELIPYGFSVDLGSRKTLTLRAPRGNRSGESVLVDVEVDEPSLEPVQTPVELSWDEERGYYHTTVAFDARDLCEAAIISARTPAGELAEALGTVLRPRAERMDAPLEFSRPSSVLRRNRPKRLELLAKRELVEQEGKRVHVGASSSDFDVRGQYVDLAEQESGHYRATVRVTGKRTGANGSIWARLGGCEAVCEVAVRDRELPPQGGVSIKLVDKDLGIFRGQFSRHNPNLLEISVQHDSVARYLKYDAQSERYKGQEAVQFRILLAEIVAESVARRLMTSQSEDGDHFMYNNVAQFAYAQYETFNKFVGKAHRIMISDGEASRLLNRVDASHDEQKLAG